MSAVQPTIRSENQAVKGTPSPLLEIEIHREVNRMPYAELVFRDGDAARQEFAYSNKEDLALGKTLDIDLAYVGGDAGKSRPPAFKGVIVRHSVEVDAAGSRLVLEVRPQAYKMTRQRKSRVFRDLSDSDIFKKVIEEYGLKATNVADTQPTHVELVQYNCTDWDFLLSRADANGLWVLVNFDEQGNERVDLIAPQLKGEPVHTFAFGKRSPLIYNLEMQTDLDQMQGAVQSTAWDREKQKLFDPVQAADFALAQGNLKAGAAAAVLGQSSVIMKSTADLERSELQSWADAQMIKSRLATIRGRLQVKGEAAYQLNDLIAIEGISGPFNGKTLITGIRHHSARQSWKTDIQFGMGAEWFTQKDGVAGLPASGLLPPIAGLRIGKVEAYKKDQQHRLLVKVSVPDIDEKEGVIWARLATSYAGKGHGLFFRPEPGDEVILGFIDDNPREAIILGGVYSEENFPPISTDKIEDENNTKTWLSRQGIQMVWDESVPSFKIATAQKGKDQPALDDPGPTADTNLLFLGKDEVVLSDVNGNTLRMDKNGITLKSKKEVKIEGKTVDVN